MPNHGNKGHVLKVTSFHHWMSELCAAPELHTIFLTCLDLWCWCCIFGVVQIGNETSLCQTWVPDWCNTSFAINLLPCNQVGVNGDSLIIHMSCFLPDKPLKQTNKSCKQTSQTHGTTSSEPTCSQCSPLHGCKSIVYVQANAWFLLFNPSLYQAKISFKKKIHVTSFQFSPWFYISLLTELVQYWKVCPLANVIAEEQ